MWGDIGEMQGRQASYLRSRSGWPGAAAWGPPPPGQGWGCSVRVRVRGRGRARVRVRVRGRDRAGTGGSRGWNLAGARIGHGWGSG